VIAVDACHMTAVQLGKGVRVGGREVRKLPIVQDGLYVSMFMTVVINLLRFCVT